jgi:hypothetical protein
MNGPGGAEDERYVVVTEVSQSIAALQAGEEVRVSGRVAARE